MKKQGLGAATFQVVRRDLYDQGTQVLLAKHMQTRPKFLQHIDTVFGNVLLESSQVSEMQQSSLHALYAEYDGKLWCRPVGDIPCSVHRDPPPEMHLPLTWDAYLGQYCILRTWIYSFLDNPFKGEFFHVDGVPPEEGRLYLVCQHTRCG